MYLTVLLMMIMLLPGCCGYAGGAPSGACNAMSPKHGASAQGSASSYTIVPSVNTYDCGDTINVTLSGADFKGFLCQARTDVSRYSTVGTLTDTDNSVTTTNNCDGEAALTHTESGVKSSFQFSWTHSGASTENIYIVCTVVQQRVTYWEKLTSAAITYSGSATTCSASGTGHIVSSVLVVCACILLNIMKLQ